VVDHDHDYPHANTRFLDGVEKWIGVLGQLRDVVRQQVLAAQLAEVLDERNLRQARVLDVGCGQGTQALLLARAGHVITGLDISTDLLSRFESALSLEPAQVRARVRLVRGPGEAAPDIAAGPYDVILCHGVLPYLDELTPMLSALSDVAAQPGILSLLVRNGHAMAMRDGLQGNWGDALAAFESRTYVNRLGLAARAHTPDELDDILGTQGWRRVGWYGVRVFTDPRYDEALPPTDELSLLLAAEQQAGCHDPYRRVAALLHVVYTRP